MNFQDGRCFQPMRLEVDESLMVKNLSIVEGSSVPPSAGFKIPTPSLLPDYEGPSIEVTPSPGICVKSRNVAGRKVFLNLCKVGEIPPAPPLSEKELIRIIEEENYETTYRVPMSLGSPREEKDKSTETCYAVDVALNGPWFDEVLSGSPVFTAFVINVAMEGLCDKYGDELNLDRNGYTILKKKNYHGKLQRHRIQKREKKITEAPPKKKVVELPRDSSNTKPALKMYRAEGGLIVAEVHLPGIGSASELELDLGEDRLKLESRANNPSYSLDIFLPLLICSDNALAEFHRKSQILKISMPLLPKEETSHVVP